MQAQKSTKKKAQPKKGKKNQKMTQIDNEEGEEETINADNQIGQSSSCCSSEDDSNASQELKGGAISSNTKGKSRASRGAATDPQSLYARVIINTSFIRLLFSNFLPHGDSKPTTLRLEGEGAYHLRNPTRCIIQ